MNRLSIPPSEPRRPHVRTFPGNRSAKPPFQSTGQPVEDPSSPATVRRRAAGAPGLGPAPCAGSGCRRWGAWAAILVLAVSSPGSGARGDAPPFEEVFSLIQSNLAGVTEDTLNEVAVRGLLEQLSPRVTLVDPSTNRTSAGETDGGARSRVYRDSIGYIHLCAVEADAGADLWEHYRNLARSNDLSGLVVDVRNAAGEDYSGALDAADRFLTEEVPLINWGEGLKRSTEKAEAITLPVAVLVGARTGGSAEALAAMLRLSGVALLIGEPTAGTAGIQQLFPLQNGQALKVTVANIQLGDAQLIPTSGLNPDVAVASAPQRRKESPEEEAANSPSPINEADLVRRWRGEPLAREEATVAEAPETRDPVLLRALDLMDGLAILRSWQK